MKVGNSGVQVENLSRAIRFGFKPKSLFTDKGYILVSRQPFSDESYAYIFSVTEEGQDLYFARCLFNNRVSTNWKIIYPQVAKRDLVGEQLRAMVSNAEGKVVPLTLDELKAFIEENDVWLSGDY